MDTYLQCQLGGGSGHCTIRWTLYYCIDRTEPLTYYTYSCMYACADIHHAQLLYTLLRDILKVYPATLSSRCVLALSSILALDPNLIVRLLHLNMNYSYFEFAHLIFQQIRGTAMGAAFSPSIANIYMSTVVNEFLQTQAVKPLIFTRYIDDIFMIWKDTQEALNTFIDNLNSVHPNLKFTHERSTQSIDFLDLTIYNFPLTNRLDVKTFQKPLNLYKYLHVTSNHPPKIFKAIIKGECIRFARTNSTKETFEATIHLFKSRLAKRGYPVSVINKATKIVKYSRRQQYLTHGQRPRPSSSPPMFKSLLPPQFCHLKQLILQDYAKLRFTSPRFITLRHPTLSNALVRARVTPTDEQFLDTALHLTVSSSTVHTMATAMPKMKYRPPPINPCQHPKCATCSYHLLLTPTFKGSNKNANTYKIRHQLSCTTSNIVYLITCKKCKKQYVGLTTKQLNTRINHHRSNIANKKSTYIAQHFNLPDHSITDLKVQPIDQATGNTNTITELYRLEAYWIKTLRTRTPEGLNVSPGILDV